MLWVSTRKFPKDNKEAQFTLIVWRLVKKKKDRLATAYAPAVGKRVKSKSMENGRMVMRRTRNFISKCDRPEKFSLFAFNRVLFWYYIYEFLDTCTYKNRLSRRMRIILLRVIDNNAYRTPISYKFFKSM